MVQARNIDWSTLSSRTPFVISANVKTNGNDITYTSDKGNSYTIQYDNAGSGMKIESGASNINKVVTVTSFILSERYQNSNIGVHGLLQNSEQAVFYLSGMSGTTAITPARVAATPTAEYQGFALPSSVNPNYQGAAARVEWTRIPGTSRWNGFFDLAYYMANVQISGLIKVDARNSSVVPTIYFPGVGGGTAGNPTSAYQSMEIYE